MESLPIHLFRDSFGPFMALLNEHDLKYTMREQCSAVLMAASGPLRFCYRMQLKNRRPISKIRPYAKLDLINAPISSWRSNAWTSNDYTN